MKSTILIEKYLDGTLKGEKLKDFVHQLQHSKELQELVCLHQEVNESIAEEDIGRFKSKLNKAYLLFRNSENSAGEDSIRDIKSSGRKLNVPKRVLLVAACLALIIIAGILFYKLRDIEYTGDELFSMYHQPYISDINIRSDTYRVDELGNAIMLYDKGSYNTAYDSFMHMVNADNENYMARFYLGLTCMELNKFDAAIEQFRYVLENCKSPVIYHSQWYLTLCYLKNNNKEEARALLEIIISANTYYRIKAEGLLKKIG